MGWYGSKFAPYVSVAERKRRATKYVAKLKKKRHALNPIVVEGRTIAHTFWGKAWCQNLEFYSDFANRLPRGRTYVRNGSVIDLKVANGEINALVSGSSIYEVNIKISKVLSKQWKNIVKQCAGKIDSLIELLQGKFSKGVMEIMTDPQNGLFPHPKEIKLNCSCPDWATMCKHVAAVLYGVGKRLDERPEELFLLRQADHLDLIATVGTNTLLTKAGDQTLEVGDLSSLFGIDIVDSSHDIAALNSKVKKEKTKNSNKTTKSVRLNKSIKKAASKNTRKV